MRRRALLGSLASAYVLARIPFAAAQPAAEEDRAAFISLSALITGRPALDSPLAQRLYDALVADNPGIAQSIRALLAFIEQRQVDALRLQSLLDTEGSPLAPVPRTIATAWFLGIVGDDSKARCVAYEDALNASIVSDVLKPPTYCYGPYGSWARKPL